jgi:hypothetical protein
MNELGKVGKGADWRRVNTLVLDCFSSAITPGTLRSRDRDSLGRPWQNGGFHGRGGFVAEKSTRTKAKRIR